MGTGQTVEGADRSWDGLRWELAHRGRCCDAGGLENLAGMIRRRGSSPESLAILVHIDVGERVEVREHLRPFFVDGRGLEPVLEGLAQDER
jgi:hypothetical protein